MARLLFPLLIVVLISACSRSGDDLDQPAVPLGQFSLGHNVVVASKAVKGPLSRKASEEQLTEALKSAIGDRFGRYEGNGLYHFGVSVEGYVLAQPGVPLVISPKSIMIIRVTVWDDAAGKKLNEEPEQFTIFESLSGETAVGSGLTQSAEEQLRNLSVNAAKRIEIFLEKKSADDGWFAGSSESVDAEIGPENLDTAAIATDE